jgi:hypothetical protein
MFLDSTAVFLLIQYPLAPAIFVYKNAIVSFTIAC